MLDDVLVQNEDRFLAWVLKKDLEEGEPLFKHVKMEREEANQFTGFTDEEIWEAEMRDFCFYRFLDMDLNVTMFSSTF